MEFFQPLEAVAPYKDDPYVFILSEPAVLAALKQLNPRKAARPDCVPIGSCVSTPRFLPNQ